MQLRSNISLKNWGHGSCGATFLSEVVDMQLRKCFFKVAELLLQTKYENKEIQLQYIAATGYPSWRQNRRSTPPLRWHIYTTSQLEP
jgi:hypothetical protein